MKHTKAPKIEVVYDFRNEAQKKKIGTVHIRVTANGRRTYATTGVRVAPSEWSPQLHVINRHDAKALNNRIEAAFRYALAQLSGTASNLTELPTSAALTYTENSAPFLDWLYKQIPTADVTEGTRKHYVTMLRNLEQYGKIKTFADITAPKIQTYINHLRNEGRTRGNIHGYYKCLARWIRIAQQQRLVSSTALIGVKCPREEAANRTRLYDDEMQKLMAAPLTPPHLLRTRDLFLVQCGTGLAYSDIMAADFTQIQKYGELYALSGVRKKTHTAYFCVVLPFAYEILKRMNFTIHKLSNTNYNKFLKSVAKVANINKNVTSHVGRHTYACLCLSRGVRIEVVQKTLGHKNIATTQIYAKLVNQDVINAFKSLSEKDFYDNENDNCKC